MTTSRTAALLALVFAASCGGGGSSSAPVIDPGDGGHYAPVIDPADFGGPIDNPYMPITPGAHWTYEEIDGEDVTTIEIVVLPDAKTVMGIPVVVVHDTATVDGQVEEDTYDWFAQDSAGNVWYMGEDTKSYEDGKLKSTKGSWEAGIDGALPGIVMPATPVADHAYRQEFYKGSAEDMAKILRVEQSVTVRGVTYDHVVVTEEWSPIEPKTIEEKYYAPGVGEVLAQAVKGGSAKEELVSYSAS